MTASMPNRKLRQAREQQGWTQAQVAEQIGASPMSVVRWEAGKAFPTPYYRQQLHRIFNRSLDELGLLRTTDAGDVQAAAMLPLSAAAVLAPMDVSAVHYVGHDAEISQLRQQLHQGGNVAIVGMPGIGKTTFAAQVAHDPAVVARYPDGVFWLGFGPQPHLPTLLNQLALRLGVLSSESVLGPAPMALAQLVQGALANQHILLIIDDLWQSEDLTWFTFTGTHLSMLITTRFPVIAHAFAMERTLVLQELAEPEAWQLLQELAPQVVADAGEALREIVTDVGGLPLALTLVGRYLQTQYLTGQPRRLEQAIMQIAQVTFRLDLAETAPVAEQHRWQETQGRRSLHASISLSVSRLAHEAQELLHALALFSPKPNSFAEDAGWAVSGGEPQSYGALLDALVDAGLVENFAPQRYALHQTIVDYCRKFPPPVATVQRLLAYYIDFTHRIEGDFAYSALDGEIPNILAALEMAHRFRLPTELLTLTEQIALFLVIRGYYREAQVHLQQCRAFMQEHANQPDQVAITLLSGIAVKEMGRLDEALLLANEAADIAQRLGLDEMHAAALKLQGQLQTRLGHIGDAELSFQHAWQLIQDVPPRHPLNRTLDTAIIIGLAQCAGRRGDYAQAEALAREGLARARRERKVQSVGILLQSLGTYANIQGRYEEGYGLYLQSLDIVRDHRFYDSLMICLTNLAVVTTEQGHWEAAHHWAREAVDLARQLDNPGGLSLSLGNLAAILIERHEYDAADAYLQEGLTLAEQMGDNRLKVCLGHTNARSARLQNLPNAEKALLEGKRLAETFQVAHIVLDFDLELGEWYLTQQQGENAMRHFMSAHQAAMVAGSQVRQGQALFGKARALWAIGQTTHATHTVRESLELLQHIHSYHADEVGQWLANQRVGTMEDGTTSYR